MQPMPSVADCISNAVNMNILSSEGECDMAQVEVLETHAILYGPQEGGEMLSKEHCQHVTLDLVGKMICTYDDKRGLCLNHHWDDHGLRVQMIPDDVIEKAYEDCRSPINLPEGLN